MIDILALIILLGLMAWRLTSLLHTEDLFEWLRKRIGIWNDDRGFPAFYPDTTLGSIFHCFWCLTLVVAAGLTLVVGVGIGLRWWLFPFVTLGASAIAIWFEKQVMRSASR